MCRGAVGDVIMSIFYLIVRKKKLKRFSCECMAAQQYAGLCKHGVATMLRYIKVIEDQNKRSQEPAKKITVELPNKNHQTDEKIQQIDHTMPL